MSDHEDCNKSIVDYMPPIHTAITENSTVQEILNTSMRASHEVGQTYTIITFDLAVAKKAYAIIWEKNTVFQNVIVRLGAFHTASSYFHALGKSMRCSGFEEVNIH